MTKPTNHDEQFEDKILELLTDDILKTPDDQLKKKMESLGYDYESLSANAEIAINIIEGKQNAIKKSDSTQPQTLIHDIKDKSVELWNGCISELQNYSLDMAEDVLSTSAQNVSSHVRNIPLKQLIKDSHLLENKLKWTSGKLRLLWKDDSNRNITYLRALMEHQKNTEKSDDEIILTITDTDNNKQKITLDKEKHSETFRDSSLLLKGNFKDAQLRVLLRKTDD